MEKKIKFNTLNSVDTEYSADSVEWCSHPNFQSYFVCGTYQLEETADDNISARNRRKGRIYLYKFCRTSKTLEEIQRLETAAILDMKWLINQACDNPMLAVVNSFGQVELYKLIDNILTKINSLELNPDCDNILALSLDWRQLKTTEFQLLVSDSKGALSLINCTQDGELKTATAIAAHDLEAWTCAYDKWDVNCIYSGSDDMLLKAYDLRSSTRIFTNKAHYAGVTCLLSHPKREHLLITGSYDEYLRTFDTRAMKVPLGELNLGGGIWRIKADPWKGNRLLTACMYNNFSIVQLAEGSLSDLAIVGEYYEHKSICYGADWYHNVNGGESDGDLYMATCSFYDHKLCLAQIEEASLTESGTEG